MVLGEGGERSVMGWWGARDRETYIRDMGHKTDGVQVRFKKSATEKQLETT